MLQVNATQLFARERGMQFSVTSIDPAAQIVYDPSDRFSSPYMNALFRHGGREVLPGLFVVALTQKERLTLVRRFGSARVRAG